MPIFDHIGMCRPIAQLFCSAACPMSPNAIPHTLQSPAGTVFLIAKHEFAGKVRTANCRCWQLQHVITVCTFEHPQGRAVLQMDTVNKVSDQYVLLDDIVVAGKEVRSERPPRQGLFAACRACRPLEPSICPSIQG